jgi:hypothetical protein
MKYFVYSTWTVVKDGRVQKQEWKFVSTTPAQALKQVKQFVREFFPEENFQSAALEYAEDCSEWSFRVVYTGKDGVETDPMVSKVYAPNARVARMLLKEQEDKVVAGLGLQRWRV